jgi:chromosome segregation ATPase
MTKLNRESLETRLQNIEKNLSELTAVVNDHNRHLDKHNSAVDKLGQQIRHLETLLKKEAVRESLQPSLQLREAVRSFVEYQINPHFYQNASIARIKSGPKVVRSALGPGRITAEIESSSEQIQ